MSIVGKNIQILRTKKRISQNDLAKKISVSFQDISDYESGKSEPGIDTLVKIADILETDVNTLIYGIPDETRIKTKRRQILLLLIVLLFLGVILSRLFLRLPDFKRDTAECRTFTVFTSPDFTLLFYSDRMDCHAGSRILSSCPASFRQILQDRTYFTLQFDGDLTASSFFWQISSCLDSILPGSTPRREFSRLPYCQIYHLYFSSWVSRSGLRSLLFALLLFLDFPVDQERQRCPQCDDACYRADLSPIAYYHRTQDLASQLELQTHGKPLGQSQLRIRRPPQIQIKSPDARKKIMIPNADKFKYQNRCFYNAIQHQVFIKLSISIPFFPPYSYSVPQCTLAPADVLTPQCTLAPAVVFTPQCTLAPADVLLRSARSPPLRFGSLTGFALIESVKNSFFHASMKNLFLPSSALLIAFVNIIPLTAGVVQEGGDGGDDPAGRRRPTRVRERPVWGQRER